MVKKQTLYDLNLYKCIEIYFMVPNLPTLVHVSCVPEKKKSVVNGCWVTCSIKINRSSSLIEMFRCSFSVYLLRLKFTSKSYPFLELSQNDHTYEDCTDLSSNHGSITHSLCALQLSSVAQLCPTLCNPMDCM